MGIQLIIDGAHITDVLAQVHTLADATRGDAPVGNGVHGGTSGQIGLTGSAPFTTSSSTTKPAASVEKASDGGKTEAKKTLTREEQDAAVEEMIAAGEKDARFDQLTKGRQKAVDDGIAAKAADIETGAAADDDLGGMFDDDDAPAEVVTAQTVRDLMGTLGKDADGNQIQDNLLKIRDILTKYIPKGEEIKVGNIPEGKLAAAYADMKKLEA